MANLHEVVSAHNAAAIAWGADYRETLARLIAAGVQGVEADAQARAEVTARRGGLPTIAKAIYDQGGPIGGAA